MNLDSSTYIPFTTKCSGETTFKVANFVERKYQKIFLQNFTTLPWTTNPVTQ